MDALSFTKRNICLVLYSCFGEDTRLSIIFMRPAIGSDQRYAKGIRI